MQNLSAIDNGEEEIETIVFKLLVDDKPLSYITGSLNEEGCYVRLFEILDHLGYKYDADWGAHTFTGYFPVEGEGYHISENSITYFGQQSVISTNTRWSSEHDLFASIGFLQELYSMTAELNMSELVVIIQSHESAPYRKDYIKSQKIADLLEHKERTVLKNVDTLPLSMFAVNALGYAASSSVNFADETTTNWGARGTLNGELLKGSYYVGYNYSNSGIRKDWNNNLRFNWEKTDIKSNLVKTILVDHDYLSITTARGSASSITLSNTKRKSYLDRTYTYEGKTQPNSEVEIYNNEQLIEYAIADSLGKFSVEVPVSSTENKITAVSYNSYGVPVATEKMIYMPAGLQQRGQFIYKLTTGATDRGDLFIAPTLEYGLASWLTFVAGNETVIGREKTTSVALLGSKMSLYRKIRLDLKYIPSTMFSTRLYGSITRALGANVFYEKYNKDQKIIYNNVQDNLQVHINGMFPKFIKGNYNLGANYSKYKYGGMLSTYIGVNVWKNSFLASFYINTTAQKVEIKYPAYTIRLGRYFSHSWYNEIAVQYLSYQKTFTLQNRVNYQFRNKLTAFAETSYYFDQNQYYCNFGIVWRLPFMRNRTGVTTTNNSTSTYTEFSGSMLIHGLNNINFSERHTAGTSLMVILFVDVNANGKYDKGEPTIKKPKMVLRIPAVENEATDGVLYTDIPPNVPFKLLVPQQKFKDISWQLSDYEANLMLSTYQAKTIYIPVKVLTEVMGEVYSVERGEKAAVSNMAVIITNVETGEKSMTYTDNWGTFIHIGLTCGTYTVNLHPGYLKQMKLNKTNPEFKHTVVIEPTEEGAQVEGLDFELTVGVD